MSRTPRAVLLSIGNELLQGRIQDRNGRDFAQRLGRVGFRIVGMRTIGDEPGAYQEAVEEVSSSCDCLLSTGGLGPTADDRVRAEAAELMGSPLTPIPGARPPLERIWKRRSPDPPPEAFLAQGSAPAAATPLANRAGTAWAFRYRYGDCLVAALPGPPNECASVWQEGGFGSFLAERFPGLDSLCLTTLHTAGLPESMLEVKVRELLEERGPVEFGITANARRVTVSVLAEATGSASARSLADRGAARVRERLGDLIWGEDEATHEGSVVRLLQDAGRTVATAESCTGGRLAAALTAVPGASSAFGQGWVVYSNRAKVEQLGVEEGLLQREGAVSEAVVLAMAQGARRVSGADYALAITGIAGPGGGAADRPVGLVWLALASAGGAHAVCRRQYARAGRRAVQDQSVRDALELLRRELLGLPQLPSVEESGTST